MPKEKNLLLVFSLTLLVQLFVFWDYLSPFSWGQIQVSGLACTCPDETVVEGQAYLKAITPDSLRHFDIDYSEIFVNERPSTSFDPMGTGHYFIKGKVTGINRVSTYDRWNLVLSIEEWREADLLKEIGIKALLMFEFIVFAFIFMLFLQKRKNRRKSYHQP